MGFDPFAGDATSDCGSRTVATTVAVAGDVTVSSVAAGVACVVLMSSIDTGPVTLTIISVGAGVFILVLIVIVVGFALSTATTYGVLCGRRHRPWRGVMP